MTSIIKKTFITLFLPVLFSLNAYSQCDKINEELNAKIRYLGSWQGNGYPNYLEAVKDTISDDIKAFINTVLPESVNIVDSGYFDDDLKSNTELLEETKLYLTYVHEGAAWKNTLGFYSYDLDNPPQTFSDIDSMTIVFPNVDSKLFVDGGQKVLLGNFPANTGVGYFLMAQGWVGDTICLGRYIVFTDKKLNTFTASQYQQHTVLLNYENGKQFLLGIEDQKRPSGDMDFNDAVFYITAETAGAIDTTDIPKIPIAIISGDTVICEGDGLATITIDFQGTPPFDVVYNNGTENVQLVDILTNSYSFETAIKDTFTLVSVQDQHGLGVVKGSAVVISNNIDAGFISDKITACDGIAEVVAEVYLTGTAPFNLKYQIDGVVTEINDINQYSIEILAEVGKAYVLAEISDKYCTKVLSKVLEIIQEENPIATLEAINATHCQGEIIDLNVNVTGVAPFTLTYNINGVEEIASVSQSPFVISVSENSQIDIIGVSSANCQGSATGSATIQFNDRPEVELVKPTINCGIGEQVELTLNFSGSAPFDYSYSISDQTFNGSTNSSDQITLEENEIFKLISYSDQLCNGIVEDSIHTFKNFATPEANIITEQATFCENGKANIVIELNGVGPFTFVISNGTVFETITTNKFEYTYLTDQEGTFEIISIENGNCEGVASGSAVITKTDAPTVELITPGLNCNATESATISLKFTGEAPFNYSYKISNNTESASSTDSSVDIGLQLDQSFELIGFSDANCSGNVSEDEFTYYNYPETTASILTDELYLCELGDMATINIQLSGKFPITFVISNGTKTETITTDNQEYSYKTSEPGVYEITSVTNGICDGTSDGAATVILIDEKPSVDFYTNNDNFCFGSNGTIVFEFTGTSPWSFTLKNGTTEMDYTSTENTLEVEVSNSGIYQIVNFSDAHCSNVITKTLQFNYLERPFAEISGGGSFCGEDESATVTININGFAPFIIVYSNGEENTEVTTNDLEYSFTTSISGNYTLVSVSDMNCDGDVLGTAVVTNLGDELNGEITGPENSCEGEDIELSFTGSQAYTSINWVTDGSGTIKNNGTATIEYTPVENESGEINFEVTVSNECGEKIFTHSVIIIETPSAEFVISPAELFSERDITFEAEELENATYTWDFGDGNTGNGSQVIHVYSVGGTYEVNLTVDVNGCENSSSEEIEVKSINQLYVPNVFNPNSQNSENKVVKVYGTNVSEEGFHFRIVNRWGNTMYKTDSFSEANSNGWDGKEINIDEMQSLSAFTWVLKGQFNDGETFEKTGTVTILQ